MQQYCIKWNNHMRNFQLTLPKYFLNQKFLDCSLLVEGKHLVECHRFVLDACSDYFASFLKNKALDDKNLVICLPNEIKLWEVQALLQFMYHGEVCISQEGLSSLVKCAELLKVKGLCGNDTTSIISKDKESSPKPKTKVSEEVEDSAMECENSNSISETIELETNGSDCCDQIIKRELCISDVEANSPSDDRLHSTPGKSTPQSHGLIRVKRNLFENAEKVMAKNQNGEETSNSLVYNKKSMDIYVKPNETEEEARSGESTPQPVENDQEFENIVCSPALMQYQYMTDNIKNSSSQSEDASANKAESLEEYDDDDDDDLFIEEANVCSNDALYNMITQKFGDCDTFSNITGNDSELNRNLMISSVGSLSQYNGSDMANVDAQTAEANEMKMAIGGLYLRNPRGNQVRQYDVNALYSALNDVKNGHSIYRAAQTYSIPRKTLRNWMKRLHIKSQFPMPKQLKQAAERKKISSQVKEQVQNPNILINAIELS